MTSLSSFSKSIRASLPDGNFSHLFIEKMSENPKDLLHFFKEACLNRNFVREKLGLMTLISIRINEFALSQVLDWDEVVKVYDFFLRFGEKSNLIIPRDLEVYTDQGVSFYSKIILMRISPKLKSMWLKQPFFRKIHLRDFASHLHTHKDLDLVYDALISRDFSIFHTVSDQHLVSYLNQFIAWECHEIEEFYKVVQSRIHHFQFALAIFACAQETSLSGTCKLLLDKFDLFFQKKSNESLFFSYEFQISNQGIKAHYLPSELQIFVESFKERLQSQSFNRVFDDFYLEKVEFRVMDESVLGVRNVFISDFEKIKGCLDEVKSLEKDRINGKIIKKIVSDGRMPIRELSLIGLLIYFKACNELELSHYTLFEPNFIKRIAQEKPALLVLSFSFCNITDEILDIVSTHYSNLHSLNFRGVKLSRKAFKSLICSLSHLKGILLADCEFSFPDSSFTTSIETLVVADNASLSSDELKKGLKSFVNLKEVSMIKVQSFSLSCLPFPEKIESLMIDCKIIEQDKKSISEWDAFTSLKELKIFGKPSDTHKEILVNLIRKYRFKVVFIPGERF